MDLFDKLTSADPPIVRPSGDLIKCIDDQREGFTVSPPDHLEGLFCAGQMNSLTRGDIAHKVHG